MLSPRTATLALSLLYGAGAFAQVPYTLGASGQRKEALPFGASASVGVGTDTWSPTDHASGALTGQGTLWWSDRTGSIVPFAVLSTSGEMWVGGAIPSLDSHRITLGAQLDKKTGLSTEIRTRASITPATWLELRPALRLGTNKVNLAFGPLLRADGRAGLSAELSANKSIRSLNASAWSEARFLPSATAPLTVIDAYLSAGYTEDPRYRLQASAGLTLAAGPTPEDPLSGLIVPGATVASVSAIGTRMLTGVVGIQLELGVERAFGTLTYTRGRALIGPTFQLAERERPPRVQPTHQVTLWVRANSAESVEFLGSETAWQALPFSRTDAGWWQLKIMLQPGPNQYLFRIDGELVTPELAPGLVDDGFGGQNAVLWVD